MVLTEYLYNVEEQRVVLPSVTWEQYESLLATLGDYPGLRLIYLEGTLEIFMPSAEHEMLKKVITRLLERYAEEIDIPLHGYGSTTFRREAKARGLEPDECYCVNTLKELPDFAIEVNLTSGGVDKLAVYKGLGIPEVLIWQNNQLTLYDLREANYREVVHSQFFPDLDLQLLAQYIRPQEQPQAIKEFLRAIRSQTPPILPQG
ncbi:Uma2 family endonuclease [Komarekiella sp. 'clone 1']|uniref:Uma2 family endonuclease n=1 Tax=Komarekiella delphini-convector SJRDD-AB1 TaxID=2593771 RepID=A0AA40VUX2_9NOST|nr:Uma2 family endonuclease [Komarekiella delphini-convector]MBD6620595.1 Uma2 family endonuclease [Komarekiella delphini-convector SJRDD-AB1]